MATLVLTAVGSAIGGPIGGAIGAVLGQQIDQAIFRPDARQGPRLSDLAIQTSTYGASLPKLFGTVRVAGTVIWATDLIETRTRQGGGKGRAATDLYSYSASLAVALSARPIERIGRVWADGKLLRGAGGDLKVQTTLRVHAGDPDAELDPAIASAEGMGSTPAYRGLAYVVFEGLQLADYGNRIPSLSFEVVADSGPIGLGSAIAALDPQSITAETGPVLGGIAAIGSSVRGLIETFAATIPMICRDGTAGATIGFDAIPVSAPALLDFGAGIEAAHSPRLATEIKPLDTCAAAVTVAYFDDARDYQPGLQRARREGAGRREVRGDLPATLDAGTARRFAEGVLATQTAERRRAKLTLPWRALALRPGDAFAADNVNWRVTGIEIERMVVRVDLVARGPAPAVSGPASAGRSVSEADAVHGPTVLAVVDLPPLTDAAAMTPQVAVYANGPSTGWRRASLLSSTDGGTTFVPLGVTGLPAAMGLTLNALPVGSTSLIDDRSTVDVELINGDATLFDADTAALSAGANLAMIGSEALQFGRALPLGGARYRLSELWRGRRGTEAAITGHLVGERFVLLESTAAVILPPDRAVAGVIVLASSVGDSDPWPTATAAAVGYAIRPLTPVGIRVVRDATGDTVSWTRRSREGWAWRDGVDVPVGEEREAYRVTRTAGAVSTAYEVNAASWTYTSAMRLADAAAGSAAVTIAIAQTGAGGVSDVATTVLMTA